MASPLKIKILEHICVVSYQAYRQCDHCKDILMSACLYVVCRAWSWTRRLWAIHLRQCARVAQRKCSATSAQVQIFYYSLVRCRPINTDCIQYRLSTRSNWILTCSPLWQNKVFLCIWFVHNSFWCGLEMGLDYCPPSQYLLPVLEHDGGKQEVDCVDGEEIAWQVSLHYLYSFHTVPKKCWCGIFSVNVIMTCCSLTFTLTLQSKFMDYEKRKVCLISFCYCWIVQWSSSLFTSHFLFLH